MKTIEIGGKQYEIDLNRITVKEYRAMYDDAESETKAVAKVTGITVEEAEAMNWNDYRRLVLEVAQAASDPLDEDALENPNP